MTVFRPLLLSGKNRQPRSKSTYSHRRRRISRRRQPVNRSRRSAAAAGEAILVDRLAFGTCLALGLGFVHRPWNASSLGFADRPPEPLQILSCQEALAAAFLELGDPARRISAFRHYAAWPANA